MPKETRKCKFCSEIFKKRFSLDMFCSPVCAIKYKKQKYIQKNGSLPTKSTGNKTAKAKRVLPKRSATGEKEVFEQIWGVEPAERRSFVTGALLPDFYNAFPWYFSHILPKGRNRYPMFKLYEKNIVLKTFQEHEQWEYHQYKLNDDPKWDHVFRLKEELIEEYEEHKLKFEAGEVEYYKT